MKKLILVIAFLFTCDVLAQTVYLPPLNGDSWETVSPAELGWDTARIDSLFDFLSEKNSKAFILLKDGKIVVEKYFGSFGKDSLWYWASAGKTLTSTLVGIAQEEGLLSIEDRSSKYLGDGWTSEPIEKENLITVRHQLTMTTGFDDTGDDLFCTDKECLTYMADAGTRWSYHNAPYTLLDKVVETASGATFNQYFFQKIRNKIGMDGFWLKSGDNNIYYSKPRSMARFGLLMLNEGAWNETDVIKDKVYLHDMINSSQSLNNSYGYLWWLNGKESYMIPQVRFVFNGMLFPDAPKDVFAAQGKNGQCLNISPSTGLVWVRMGDAPDNQLYVTTEFNNDIWKYIKEITNFTSVANELAQDFAVNPNPASDYIEVSQWSYDDSHIMIYNSFGELVAKTKRNSLPSLRIDVANLPTGVYFVKVGNQLRAFVKI